ncbi:hypothetical protein [Faecalicatena orotica]|uniref:hypothetical protein n=1 Tax=Faecalicatena orotica TaxID=1544 RepID=UPI003217CD87
MKRLVKFLVICLCVVGTIGCAKKTPPQEENKTGEEKVEKQDREQIAEIKTGLEYFVEEKVSLPEEAVNVMDVRKSGDTILIASSEGRQKSSLIWKTDDKGESWERVLDLPEMLQYSLVSEALFVEDNSLICGVQVDLLKEGADTANRQKKYYKVNLQGDFIELSSDMSNQEISILQYYDSQIYGTNQRDGIFVFDGETGALKESFDKMSGQINGFCIMNDKIFIEGIDHIEILDALTGEPVDADEKLRGSLDPVLLKGSRTTGKQGFIDKMICDPSTGLLYYINADALYQYDFADAEFKEVLYGKNYRFAEEEMVLMEISSSGDHELSIVTYKNNTEDLKTPVKPEMYWYTYVPEGIES